MRIRRNNPGYTMRLSAKETFRWASLLNCRWPRSTLENKRLCVTVDSNGLCDFVVSGKDGQHIDGHELAAIVADHLPADLREFWPTWNKAVKTVEAGAA